MSRKKKYWDMTTEELAEATKEFDRESIVEAFRPMTPAEEAQWRSPWGSKPVCCGVPMPWPKARHQPGRPRRGKSGDCPPACRSVAEARCT